MQNVQMQLAKELAKECRTVEDIHNKLKDLFKDSMQQILEAEISDHLGYDKHNPDGNNTGNSRNGYSKKTVKTKYGQTEINVPRDRNAEFDPQIIKKYENTSRANYRHVCQRIVDPRHRRPNA